MSSDGLVLGNVVLPGRSVDGHRPVNAIDEVALKDAACAAGTPGGFVSSK